MTEFLAALIGALVGASAVFLGELWKQVLSGKAAARILYVEAHHNSLACSNAAADGQLQRALYDDAWRTHGIRVAPLMTSEASSLTVIAYLALPHTAQEGDAEDFRAHSRDFRVIAYWMHCIEMKSRFRLLLELHRDAPTLPSAEDVERAIAACG